MSASRGVTVGGSTRSRRPARPDAVVAVLERRGRFLVAEPLFRDSGDGGRGRRDRQRLAVRPSGGERAAVGDVVLVEPPRRGSAPRILRVIGRQDVARDLIEALMLDRGLRRGFEEAVEREAEAAAARVRRAPEGRRDLRELPTFTIDPVDARDFDDAISAQALDDALTRVWVHIADVAAHVPDGSLVDREARRRGTSVYVPGAVEPMLPLSLSSDACSLRPDADRAAVTVELELRGAAVIRASFYRSLIRSDVRLDYDRVDRMFAGREPAAAPWRAPLQAARAVAAELQRKREQSGALVIDSEEPEFSFDERGNVIEVRGRVQTESHRLVEHLMIAANEAVAGVLSQRRAPCLYRVHERPDPERIEYLAEQLASLEVPTPPLPKPMSATQATELLGEISRRLERHLRRARHGRIALNSLVLRSLKQAYYSPRNLGHAGLRSSAYCHFTSPIRRYPDLVCHRALLSAIGEPEPAPPAAELGELGTWTSEREREAMELERDADDVARCFALERVLYEDGADEVFGGEITGLISAGAFVAFDRSGELPPTSVGPPFEGMLPVRLLRAPAPASTRARPGRDRGEGERDWWTLNEQGTVLRGERTGATLRLGDPIDVRVARLDAVRGRVDLLPAG